MGSWRDGLFPQENDAQVKRVVSIMDRRLKDGDETFTSLSICDEDRRLWYQE